jgi:hypothetical protein
MAVLSLPLLAGVGLLPSSAAKDLSERSRWGLSPATTCSVLAVSGADAMLELPEDSVAASLHGCARSFRQGAAKATSAVRRKPIALSLPTRNPVREMA